MVSKKTTIIVTILAALVIWGMPWYGIVSIDHPFVYCIGMGVLFIWSMYRLLTWDAQDRKFYKRWSQVRDRSVTAGTLIEGLKFGIFFLILNVFVRYSLGGMDRLYAGEWPSKGEVILIILLTIVFIVICGVTATYQKNKRYDQLQMRYEDY